MTTVVFIPVRGGSKGVPKKNIKLIAGKPLVAWSIEQALAADLVDEVFVSTDCPEIASISKSHGAQVPFLRPEDISSDGASTESAMLHFCDWLASQGKSVKKIMLLQATSPVRGKGRLDDAIRYFEEKQLDSLLSVTKSHRFFWKEGRAGEKVTATYDYNKRPRRQDIQDEDIYFMESGSFYITKIELLKKTGSRLCGNVGLYDTPEEESYEIDSHCDFTVCEVLLNEMVRKKCI